MHSLPKVLAHWEVGVHDGVPEVNKPLLCSLSSLTTVLRIVWAGPVSLPKGPNIGDVGFLDVMLPLMACPHQCY